MKGQPAGSISGDMKCTKKCTNGTTDAGVPFTLTTTTGSIRHGICGYTDQIQAETSGLMFAISNDGVGVPPQGFDEAMLNTSKATVYTYYECSKFKSACKFK